MDFSRQPPIEPAGHGLPGGDSRTITKLLDDGKISASEAERIRAEMDAGRMSHEVFCGYIRLKGIR